MSPIYIEIKFLPESMEPRGGGDTTRHHAGYEGLLISIKDSDK